MNKRINHTFIIVIFIIFCFIFKRKTKAKHPKYGDRTKSVFREKTTPPGVTTQMSLKERVNLRICTYNIIHGGNSSMALAMKTMKQMNIHMGIITETKLKDGMFTQSAHGYTIIATEGQNNHQGGITLSYQTENNQFIIERTKHSD
jgi:hypothetical protein